MDYLTTLALNQLPKKEIVKWQVSSRGVILFENVSVKLCYHFVKINALRLKPTPIYN